MRSAEWMVVVWCGQTCTVSLRTSSGHFEPTAIAELPLLSKNTTLFVIPPSFAGFGPESTFVWAASHTAPKTLKFDAHLPMHLYMGTVKGLEFKSTKNSTGDTLTTKPAASVDNPATKPALISPASSSTPSTRPVSNSVPRASSTDVPNAQKTNQPFSNAILVHAYVLTIATVLLPSICLLLYYKNTAWALILYSTSVLVSVGGTIIVVIYKLNSKTAIATSVHNMLGILLLCIMSIPLLSIAGTHLYNLMPEWAKHFESGQRIEPKSKEIKEIGNQSEPAKEIGYDWEERENRKINLSRDANFRKYTQNQRISTSDYDAQFINAGMNKGLSSPSLYSPPEKPKDFDSRYSSASNRQLSLQKDTEQNAFDSSEIYHLNKRDNSIPQTKTPSNNLKITDINYTTVTSTIIQKNLRAKPSDKYTNESYDLQVSKLRGLTPPSQSSSFLVPIPLATLALLMIFLVNIEVALGYFAFGEYFAVAVGVLVVICICFGASILIFGYAFHVGVLGLGNQTDALNQRHFDSSSTEFTSNSIYSQC